MARVVRPPAPGSVAALVAAYGMRMADPAPAPARSAAFVQDTLDVGPVGQIQPHYVHDRPLGRAKALGQLDHADRAIGAGSRRYGS